MNTRLNITQLYDLFLKDYPDVLSTKDAMEILQISDKTLYRLLHSGQLKSIRIRNSFRIPKLFLLQDLGIVSEDEL